MYFFLNKAYRPNAHLLDTLMHSVTEFFFKTDLPDRASTMYNLLARRTNALARILHELSLHY